MGRSRAGAVLTVRIVKTSARALHVVLSILPAPRALADELEAAGSIALDRSGAILDARIAAAPLARP
jgi:hypothetical protein